MVPLELAALVFAQTASPAPVPANSVIPHQRASAMRPLAGYFARADYPAAALRTGQEGRVVVALGISETGRVRDCRIALSSGSAVLDATTCRILRSRARYRPALDVHGHAMADVDADEIVWRLPTAAGADSASSY